MEAQGFKFTYLSKTGVYLKLKDNSDRTKLAAAFLETHRYAAYMGASMALTKNEGTTVNIADKKAYSALANIVDSMVEGGSGYLAEHNVKFPKITAGGILEHTLTGGRKTAQILQSIVSGYLANLTFSLKVKILALTA